MYNNCTGVIETDIERVCLDVNELVCDLVEAIHYETLEETYQVQRCFTGKDRVCDTTYKIDMTTKDDYQCTNVETPNCFMEEKVINDVTCTNSVEFNCKRDKSTKNDSYGPKGVICERKPTQNCYHIPRKRKSTVTPRIVKSSLGRYATSARKSPSGQYARCRRDSSAFTNLWKTAGMRISNIVIRWRRWCWRKYAI